MENYQEARVKLTNTQLNKLRSAGKNKTGTILRLNKKNFEDKELSHELFLTTGQTTKIRNAFTNNMSIDIKLTKTQISQIIQSGGSLGSWLASLGRKALKNVDIPLARDSLPGLLSNLTSSAISVEKKLSKEFTLLISNEDMNDIIKIIKSLEDSSVLIDGVTKTVKDEIKKTRRWISWTFFSTFSRFISTTSNFFKWKRS